MSGVRNGSGAVAMRDRRGSDGREDARRRRASSVRLGLSLASIAIVFFLGVVFSRSQQAFSELMSVAGIALMVILAVLILIGSRR